MVDGMGTMRILRTVGMSAVCALIASGCLLPGQTTESAVMAAPSSDVSPKPAAAITIPAPQWKVGDSWTYSDGYGMKVTEVNADGTAEFTRLDDADQWFVRRGFFTEESKSRTIYRRVVFRTSDPMDLLTTGINQPVSFVREYMRNDELVRHRTSWVIEGREKITVPAGTFDCWVIVMRTQGLDSNWRGFERWYYNPDARNYIRLEYKYGESPNGSRVLMEYKLAG
ncbi:MAG: hypothetical protein A3G18_08865 [Rhodospirillales bacterium RIFCSPLOWO2_12_FULL_58_28]|nr:MAG: hypothetical protein A3H92_01460 [Rhodospirillales bacterium RIFCSPLOWO2_02_FULL_58_16]OHC78417.1 MAG: hypothetical protein A3G18_08865 [Rhodospirillales bacterium RIFCSPLOWO2_12_FULL_58_28]